MRGLHWAVLVLALVILCLGAFSTLAEIRHMDHFCVRDQCPVCACLAHLQAVCRELGAALGVSLAVLAAICLLAAGRRLCPVPFTAATPMANRTRLNN